MDFSSQMMENEQQKCIFTLKKIYKKIIDFPLWDQITPFFYFLKDGN